MANKKPIILIINDGWGIGPPTRGNAVKLAKTPNLDEYEKYYYKTALATSGPAVGLPMGVMGNSEVGHKNIGCGFILPQSMDIIDKQISTGVALNNVVFAEAFSHVMKNSSSLHLIGLASPGGAHSHLKHLLFLIKQAHQNLYIPRPIYIHAFTDGRDGPPKIAAESIEKIEEEIKKLNANAKIATIMGRYFGMDRNNNWDRMKKAYDAIVNGIGEKSDNIYATIINSYKTDVTDEFIAPTVMIDKDGEAIGKVQENDAIIFFNFRPDRARQLTRCFVDPTFDKFEVKKFNNLYFATFTEYDIDLKTHVAFPEISVQYPLARILAENNLTQLHIAETEKYAHATYFFNGGTEHPYRGEDRVVVPSPNVATFDQMPEMSALGVTTKILEALDADKYDFIIVNFANLDMVGHTGNLEATIHATEIVDECIGRIVKKILSLDGVALLTADHGNAEEVINLKTGEKDTEHSLNPVPFIVVANKLKKAEPDPKTLLELAHLPSGTLADIMPTILELMSIKPPEEATAKMSGFSLLGRLR